MRHPWFKPLFPAPSQWCPGLGLQEGQEETLLTLPLPAPSVPLPMVRPRCTMGGPWCPPPAVRAPSCARPTPARQPWAVSFSPHLLYQLSFQPPCMWAAMPSGLYPANTCSPGDEHSDPTCPVGSEKGCRDPQMLCPHPTVLRLPLRRARGWPRGGRASGRQTLQVSLASPDLCSLTELSPLARSQGLGGPRWAEADTQGEVAFLNQCP